MARSCFVTLWERLNEKGEWEFNHITEGIEEGTHPKPKDPSYELQRGWSRGKWRRSYGTITNDDKIIRDGEPSKEEGKATGTT